MAKHIDLFAMEGFFLKIVDMEAPRLNRDLNGLASYDPFSLTLRCEVKLYPKFVAILSKEVPFTITVGGKNSISGRGFLTEIQPIDTEEHGNSKAEKLLMKQYVIVRVVLQICTYVTETNLITGVRSKHNAKV